MTAEYGWTANMNFDVAHKLFIIALKSAVVTFKYPVISVVTEEIFVSCVKQLYYGII